MDYFKRLFVVAFAISALALVVAFMAGRRAVMNQPAEEVLWRESIAQLKVLGDHKYRQSIHYIAYAKYAARDSLNAEAALFHAMSHADAVLFSSTADHLHHAHEDRHHTHTHLLPPAIAQSLADGNRYIARMLTWCDASDVKQMILLSRLRSQQPLPSTYRVCPTCGDIDWEEVAPRYCPHCMTDSAKFLRFHYPAEE